MSTSKTASDLAGPMYDLVQAGGTVAASCPGGNQSCLGGQLALADESPVHDAALIKLTRKINHLLAETAEKGKRRHLDLELLSVGDQVLLAWTSRDVQLEGRRVTQLDEIRRLLGVKPRKPMYCEDSDERTYVEPSDQQMG